MIHFHKGTARTVENKPTKRVIVAPHADDEVLGCGGLLSMYPHECVVVVLAKPDDVRMKEFEAAKYILDYSAAHIMDLQDGHVGADQRLLVSLLDNVLLALRPQELYLPYPSMHQDHIAAYEAGIRASRLSMGSAHWFTPNVFVYDVAAYDVNLYETSLQWNVFQPLNEMNIDKKVAAIHMYSSQASDGPHPVNGIKEIAHSTGAARQVRWAEKYALVRGVRS